MGVQNDIFEGEWGVLVTSPKQEPGTIFEGEWGVLVTRYRLNLEGSGGSARNQVKTKL